MNEDFADAEAKARAAEEAASRIAETKPPKRSLFQREDEETPKAQSEFNRAIAAALLEIVRTCQAVIAEQQTRIAHVEQQAGAVLSLSERFYEFQRRMQTFEDALAQQSTDAEQHLGKFREEMRERIQALLDEQRVCIRQLTLQTSEEAVLADRARRATELRLDEMARRLEQLLQSAAA